LAEGKNMKEAIVTNVSLKTGIKVWEIIGIIALIGMMVFSLLACTSSPNEATKLEGVTWVLKSYGDATNPTGSVAGHEPTLTFDKEKKTVSGNGGVNGYGGDYTRDGDKLKLGSIVHTLIASTNPALNTQETAYFKILASAGSFKISGVQLTITGTEGILVFTQQ
jgi:heat shock protein HslJ